MAWDANQLEIQWACKYSRNSLEAERQRSQPQFAPLFLPCLYVDEVRHVRCQHKAGRVRLSTPPALVQAVKMSCHHSQRSTHIQHFDMASFDHLRAVLETSTTS